MRLRRRSCARRGQAMVEFALSMPLLVLVLSGVIEMSLLISHASSLQEAVNQAARSAAAERCDIDIIRGRVASLLKNDRLLEPDDLKVDVEESVDMNGSPNITVQATLRLHPFAFKTMGSFSVSSSATFRKEWGGPLP